ncbi:MAG: hypothetical protein J5963_06785 [Schwartzia sp.]|nr:hypothetical protein [Schwartzia sp. (in: firmicutes)]
MSIWTHVCGCIRVDDLGLDDTTESLMEIKNILGVIIDPDRPDFDPSAETEMPCGSEGSLKYQIIDESSPEPNVHNVAAYTIPIWGDLRDFKDGKSIEDWFLGVCEAIHDGLNENLFVRQACIVINVQGQKTRQVFFGED